MRDFYVIYVWQEVLGANSIGSSVSDYKRILSYLLS